MENKNVEVKGLLHLEMLHDDPAAAAEFLQKVLGAERCEQEFAGLIGHHFDCECIHMKAGNIIFQLIKPNKEYRPELNTWWDRDLLEKQGPFVHNVTMLIRNADQLAKNLVEAGGRRMGEVESITPDGKGKTMVYMYDVSKECGMRFEFVEAPPEMG